MRRTSHVHAHAPHELSEPAEAGVSRRERILELCEGGDAKTHDDRYILSTVFFATGGIVFVASLPVA